MSSNIEPKSPQAIDETTRIIGDEEPSTPQLLIPTIGDEAVPLNTPVFVKRRPGTHDQETRKNLAYTVLGLLGVLYIGATAALIFGFLTEDKFTLVIAAISGPQALGAAVIGFYYGKKDS